MKENYNTRATLLLKIKDQYNEQSWDQFNQFYRPYIFTVIKNMGAGSEDAEDITQQVLLKLWQKLPGFEYSPEKCKFRTWMNLITSNTVKNFFRGQSRYFNFLERFSMNSESDVEELNPEVYKLMNEKWKVHMVDLALENISPQFSGKALQCFEMFNKNCSIEQICTELDLKRNSAYVLRKRVLEKLSTEVRRLDDELS